MESHRKGDLTEAIVIAELKRRGLPVALPFGDNERYDLLVETPGGPLLRVQVKTGWLEDDTVEFHGKSQHTNASGNVYRPYDGDVDAFIVYSHDLETMYLVREDEFNRSLSLRVEAPAVESRRVNQATAFEFDARWPLAPGDEPNEPGTWETVSLVVERLTAADITVAKPVDGPPGRLVIEERDGDLAWVRVKTGRIRDGRIRYTHEAIPERIDYLVIYVHESTELYVVPRASFNASITLRVEEPAREDDRINWAEDYVFPDTVPWA